MFFIIQILSYFFQFGQYLLYLVFRQHKGEKIEAWAETDVTNFLQILFIVKAGQLLFPVSGRLFKMDVYQSSPTLIYTFCTHCYGPDYLQNLLKHKSVYNMLHK